MLVLRPDGHKYEDCNKIVNEALINDLLERTQKQVREGARLTVMVGDSCTSRTCSIGDATEVCTVNRLLKDSVAQIPAWSHRRHALHPHATTKEHACRGT